MSERKKSDGAGEFLTTGDVCVRLGVRQSALMRLLEKGAVPQPPQVGGRRVFTGADLPALEKALREAGYLK